VSTISTTEDTTDRSLVAGLASTLEACSGELARTSCAVSRVWAAAASSLKTEALCAAFDPLAPPWLIVDELIALIVDQAPIDAEADEVVAIDRSLSGLRSLVDCLRRQLPAGK
jgi:hypothetical protein